MHFQDDMEDSDCGLSLHDIHTSIETTIRGIREKHEQVDSIFGDIAYLRRIVDDVLRPINDKKGLDKVSSIADLQTLLDRCSRTSPTNTTGTKSRLPTPPTTQKPRSRALSDGRINVDRATDFSLPPIKSKSQSAKQRRNSPGSESSSSETIVLPVNVNTSCRTEIHVSPSKLNHDKAPRLGFTNFRRERLLRRQNHVETRIDSSLNIKHFELNRFLDDFERELSVLQETFSTFTQKTLVPLQTFCKQCEKSTMGHKKDRTADETTEKRSKTANDSLDETQFRIVQTMNQIRQLLWPNDATGLPEHLFCDEHFSKQVVEEVDCAKFPIVRLIPDVLQKFNEVLCLAMTWLKRDLLYVQNTKSGLHRAHRRFLKTEKLWRQARDSQRQLRNEFDDSTSDLQSQSARLNTLVEDIAKLQAQLARTQKIKLIVEERLKSSDDNIETLVARHRSLRKQIILLSTKIEARERSHGFLSSRVLSLKADQGAVSEKLRISEEYTSSLQTKMEELYRIRDAWSRRYEEKTDPDRLDALLDQSRIRMPLPSLREKTFVIRTGMEEMRRALDIVEKRLDANEIHWSKLCEQLPWPSDDHTQQPTSSDKNGLAEATPGQDSPNSQSSIGTEKSDNDLEKIKDVVITAIPQDEKQQTSFMLQLWIQKNGKEATVEKLIHALKASSITSVAESIERQMA